MHRKGTKKWLFILFNIGPEAMKMKYECEFTVEEGVLDNTESGKVTTLLSGQKEVTCAPPPPSSPPSHSLSWILIGLLALMFLYSCLITAFYIRLTVPVSLTCSATDPENSTYIEMRKAPRPCSPVDIYFLFGSWFDHVKSWLNAEDEEHIMHISYEQMIMDLKDSVCNMAQFLQKSLDDEAIEKIADRCLFKNMKKNNMSNYSTASRELLDQTKSEFLRKRIAGDWKKQLTPAEAAYFDAVYKDKMKDVKYTFAWD
ncbi:Sulfotransferase 2B1 [Dissostichus eleginoides]|uniref:Sulfotransferase n=1 Tax=Dissostichus eleginoides TaxID=100907 RepID=A0AAD9CHV3_DISEL|nr:Sulfotransferase 2B1 [Dissostichus eleginoides]